jgi:hypothetical protein
MLLEKTWYSIEEAAAKYGVEQKRILKWATQGTVRSEEEGGEIVRVNIDDLALLVDELTGN